MPRLLLTLSISATLALVLLAGAAAAQAPEPPGNRLPGNLENVAPPPLALANTSARSIPVLAAANNTLPVVDVEVRTVGGITPIKFAIVGGAAAQMFEIVQPQADGITRVLSPAEEAAAEMKARFEARPAGPAARVLRFRGAANASALPLQLPVQVRATDGGGASIVTIVTAYPFAPRVAPITTTRTARETWGLNLNVQGLGNANQMRVDAVGGACSYRQNDEVIYPATHNVANGAASVLRTASFRTSAASCNGLRVTMAVRFPDSPAFTAPIAVTVPSFTFRAPQVYAFGHTWGLRTFFDFKLNKAHVGSCSGTSGGTAGDHAIGVHESSDDIAFAIRSGPLGTECDYLSVSRRLPDGFALTRLQFAKSEGPNTSLTNVQMTEPKRYCRIDGSGGTLPDMFTGKIGPVQIGTPQFTFDRGAKRLREYEIIGSPGPDLATFVAEGFQRPLQTPDTVDLVTAQDGHYAVVEMPMFLRLNCVITLSNTEFIRLRLDRAEFVGPPGVAFP